jgi:hypothetical protein
MNGLLSLSDVSTLRLLALLQDAYLWGGAAALY